MLRASDYIRQQRRKVGHRSPTITRLVAVLLVFVAVLNVWGMPTGGRWHEEDGSLCPIGADWLIPLDRMQFVTPAQKHFVIERTQPGTIPDDGGQCFFVSFDTAPSNAHPPVVSPPLIAEVAPPSCALLLPSPVVTEDVPAYYPHGPPPLLPRAAFSPVAPRAPPVCS